MKRIRQTPTNCGCFFVKGHTKVENTAIAT